MTYIYITKWCLSQGIIKTQLISETESALVCKPQGHLWESSFKKNKEAFLTEEEAQANAQDRLELEIKRRITLAVKLKEKLGKKVKVIER